MTQQDTSKFEIYRRMLDLQKGEDFHLNNDELIEYYGDYARRHIELINTDTTYRGTFNKYASPEMLEKETKYTINLLSTHKDGKVKGTAKALFYIAASLPTMVMQQRRETKLTEIALGPEPKAAKPS